MFFIVKSTVLIAFLEGNLVYKNPAFVYIDTGGIGYHVNVSLNTYSKIESLDKVRLFTHLHVKEDAHTLYGFFTEDEKQIFVLLISVSGIGPNTARVILSYMTASEVKNTILREDVARFKSVKGVGPKTAQRIILDLKDKVMKSGENIDIQDVTPVSSVRDEASAALMALGFQKNMIDKHINSVLGSLGDDVPVEEVIKEILKKMS